MSDEISHIVSRLIEKLPIFRVLSLLRDWERQYWAEVAKVLAKARQHTDRKIHALVAELTKRQAEFERKWEEHYRYPYPQTLEDWYRLAVFAGLDATIVYQGNWTPRDILPIVEGYLHRRNEMQKCNVDFRERDDWAVWGHGRLVSVEHASRPLAIDVAKFSAASELAEALFPGNGETPRWSALRDLLQQTMDPDEVRKLRCYDALALVQHRRVAGAGDLLALADDGQQMQQAVPNVVIVAEQATVVSQRVDNRLRGSGAECQEVDEFDESVQIKDPVAEEQAKPANKSENASPEATCELPPVTESRPKKESRTQRPTRQVDHVVSRILSVYARKCSDQRFQEIVRILNNPNLTIDGKLWEIDKVLPIPVTASSQVLANLLGVSKAAIVKTDWWQKNRRRQKERDCAAREERLEEKGKLYDWPGGYDRDDDG